MQIQPLGTNLTDVPLERLGQNTALSEPEKVHQLCRQFEALLLREILQQAQKTVIPSKLNPENVSSGIYKDMVTSQLADAISKTDSLGLAGTLEGQLTRQLSSDGAQTQTN